jgi:hypothetical protein
MTESVHDRAFDEQVPHRHVPGRAYEVADAAIKLIHTVGGGFFNEPKYYDSNRTPASFYAELAATGRISSVIAGEMGLSEQAREVVETAHAVAVSATPEDLLVIAAWARDPRAGLRLRTTPAVLLAVAAAHPGTKPFVARYAPAVLRRADEVRLAFALFRHFFQAGEGGRHKGGLPHGLRKGLAAVLAGLGDYELLKYDDRHRPTFADVLKMVGGSRQLPRRKAAGWPVSRAMFSYLVHGTVTDDAPPVLRARRQFFATKDAAAVTPELVREAALTWENVVSHLGGTAAAWELAIPVMGEMALTRNLRNFEQAGISPDAWQRVCDRLLAVEDTVQLPFRFFAAERHVTNPQAREVLRRLLDRACAAVSDLPGVSLVLTDNSGSCACCAVSGASDLRVADAGNMLGAVLARRMGGRVLLGVFGDSFVWVPFTASDDCLAIKKRMDDLALTEERSRHGALAIPQFATGAGVGQSTETGLWWALDDVTRRRVWLDRILLVSDLCCYTQGDVNCGIDLGPYFGKGATVASMVDRYRREVNPRAYVYSINLSGHGQSQLRPQDGRTHLLSGWSERLVDVVRDLEAGQANRPPEAATLPTIEALRARYRR